MKTVLMINIYEHDDGTTSSTCALDVTGKVKSLKEAKAVLERNVEALDEILTHWDKDTE